MDLNNIEGIKNAPKKKKKNNTSHRRAAHNSAGHTPGVKIKTPSVDMNGIYADDSPTRNTDHTPNQESDNSHFSRGNDGVNASTHSNKSNHEKQVQEKEAQDKVKRKRQHQKNKLSESQRKKDNNTECIDLEEEEEEDIDNSSTQGCFDGIPTDKVRDPKQQQYMDQLKDKFGEEDDYNKIVKRSKNHRGNSHGESSLAQSLSNSNNPTRMLAKDRKKHQQRDYSSYGRANLERGGGRVMAFDGSDDPLDVAASQQRTDRGSSSNDMAVPKLKKNNKGGKKAVDMGRSVVGKLQKWGGSTKSKREKVAESSKREKQAAAALMRQTRDSSSSGEKRKRSDSAIDVDDEEDMMGATAAASNQRFVDKPKKVVELPSLGISRATEGRVGKGKYETGESACCIPLPNTHHSYNIMFMCN